MNNKAPRSVYIHIPFCTNKCYYCDFNSYVVNGQPVDDYLQALEREMEATVRLVPPGEIDTVFVGGGTPTVLTPEQMERFLRIVNTYFPERTADAEFSMEANPGTTDEEKLAVMKAGGVNRISFGAQSFDAGLLQRIGRIHNPDDIYRSIDTARKLGFGNLSIDLMFGLPGQTMDLLEQSLAEAISLGLEHYSVYSLIIEENTLFHTLYRKNKLPLPDEDEEAAMFTAVIARMRSAGYRHYEISNFAKPGFESRHNTAYWRNWSYYGLGAGAHGYVQGIRHVNIKGIAPYIEAAQSGLPRAEQFAVRREEAMEDFMMVGLRMLDGVSNADFREQFGVEIRDVFGPVIDKLIGRGLLRESETGFRLTEQGLVFGNEVFAEFVGICS